MPSFRELFESIKEDLLAYTTIKVVKTKDWRLSSMQRFFNVGVGIYILFAIVFYHGYLNKESPVITVSTVMDGAAMAQYLANASLLYSNGGYPYAYCSSWVTNATNVSAATTRTVRAAAGAAGAACSATRPARGCCAPPVSLLTLLCGSGHRLCLFGHQVLREQRVRALLLGAGAD